MKRQFDMHRVLCAFLILCTLFATLALSACTEAAPPEDDVDYAFVSGTTTIRIDDDAAAVLSALGAWSQYGESPSCLFDGLDKIYGYGGFRIQTYPKDGGEFVYSVELLDDSVTTPEGITIGSSRDDVLEQYGTDMRETSAAIIYTDKGDGVELMLSIRNGVVTNIQYKKIVA
jgi:hypothetical protein